MHLIGIIQIQYHKVEKAVNSQVMEKWTPVSRFLPIHALNPILTKFGMWSGPQDIILNPFVTAAYPPAVLAYVKSKKIYKKMLNYIFLV